MLRRMIFAMERWASYIGNRSTMSAAISDLYRSHHSSFPGFDRVNASHYFGPWPLFRGANKWAAARLHEIQATSAEVESLTL